MANLSGMTEHCTSCGAELELGQIGLCDDCQSHEYAFDVKLTAVVRVNATSQEDAERILKMKLDCGTCTAGLRADEHPLTFVTTLEDPVILLHIDGGPLLVNGASVSAPVEADQVNHGGPGVSPEDMNPPWSDAASQAASKEGWDIMYCLGSSYGPWQVNRLDDASETPGAKQLDSDDDAQELVMKGTAPHHQQARAFIKAHNPDEYAYMEVYASLPADQSHEG